MARRQAHQPLNVLLNGRLVGLLRRESSGAIDFQYAQDWLAWESTFPISLSLPLREDRYIGAPVINVFDNLLPDSDLIRRRIAERVGADGIDAHSMLSALGHDCVGALQFLPDGVVPGAIGDVAGKPVSDDDVAEMIRNLSSSPLGISADEDFRCKFARNTDPLRADFASNSDPSIGCVSMLLGPVWPGRILGDDVRGRDRQCSARVFRSAPSDQGDRADAVGVAGDGAQGHSEPQDRVQV